MKTPRWKKEIQRPRKIKDVEKIHAGAREVLQHKLGDFVWASGGGRREVGHSRNKFSEGEQREMKLLGVQNPTLFRQVAPDSATQCIWLRNRKVKPQVNGINQCRFPGRKAVGKVEEAEPATERRIE